MKTNQSHWLACFLTGNKADKRLLLCHLRQCFGGCQLPWEWHLHIAVRYSKWAAACESWLMQLSPKHMLGKQVKTNIELRKLIRV
uniref:Uncharacterized protein n=1 Tax=Apteryx owenii TaxID=8824 RepID=A0A8B9QEM1_APTOW